MLLHKSNELDLRKNSSRKQIFKATITHLFSVKNSVEGEKKVRDMNHSSALSSFLNFSSSSLNWSDKSLESKRGWNFTKIWSFQEEQDIYHASICTLSIMSGLFVAAKIVTSFSCSIPSISVSNWAKTRSATFPAPEELIYRKKEKVTALSFSS